MRFPLEVLKKESPSEAMKFLSPVFAVCLTLIVGFLVFALVGKDPLEALYIFCVEPLLTLNGWGEIGVKMTPLILCALGLIVCYKANIWNIGAEGQLIIGALAGGAVALTADENTSSLLIVFVFLVAMIAGGLYAGICAWLKNKCNANEILVSLMLVYIAELFLSWAVQSPLRDPSGLGFPQSPMFEDAATLPIMVEGTRLHWGASLVVVALAFVWLLMTKMFIGFKLRVTGLAPKAAVYGGFNNKRLVYFAFILSGALAGLAGIIEVTGPIGQLTPKISPGYGFAAIIVAFVGRLRPLGVIPAAFVMALFYLGGELAQLRIGTPASMTNVFQGVLLFAILICDSFIYYRLKWIGFGSGQSMEVQ